MANSKARHVSEMKKNILTDLEKLKYEEEEVGLVSGDTNVNIEVDTRSETEHFRDNSDSFEKLVRMHRRETKSTDGCESNFERRLSEIRDNNNSQLLARCHLAYPNDTSFADSHAASIAAVHLFFPKNPVDV